MSKSTEKPIAVTVCCECKAELGSKTKIQPFAVTTPDLDGLELQLDTYCPHCFSYKRVHLDNRFSAGHFAPIQCGSCNWITTAMGNQRCGVCSGIHTIVLPPKLSV